MAKKDKNRAAVRRAVKGHGFLTPAYSASVRRFIICVGGFYLRFVEGVSRVSFIHEERLIDAMRGFNRGEHRLIFVFRHAAKEDPPVLMYSFSKLLRRKIERYGGLSHLRFLYGRDVPNWAGKISAWLFPRIGAIPVQNRAGNREALSILHREAASGRFPIALAPEEQVVYHMYRTFSIAPGTSSLVKWGLESGKPVMVVPLALGYTYGAAPEAFIRDKLAEWEGLTGQALENRESAPLHKLLCAAVDGTLSLLEPEYNLPEPVSADRLKPEVLDKRITALCESLLCSAEKAAGLLSEGSNMDRLFRIRYAGTDSFYPEHPDPETLPRMKRALLDFNALKAEVFIRHERIYDVLEYIHMDYISPPFSAGRGCEFILNLIDLVFRTLGGTISSHKTPSGQHAAVLAGEPLIYTKETQASLSRREFLASISSDIKTAFETVSEELEVQWEKVKLQ
ncbi:MAG: hypothetical protein PQJ61_16265 [Spirochaetales bacterium]|uniref:Phospholipid/glycerol acyltransferase domain-containing protein n=1 Tax=Candidatus Thalassospirochaeta sargassi TaxID=3119039 RepID=A0AAJ1MK81_9SPIO|nr:hypothetical protein [Spirochaetales bacterium]